MNANDEHVAIEDHPRLSDHPNQSAQTNCNSDSIAGVGADAESDAGLALDMTFVGSDPLSELVWSPRKGLSIRCAVGSVPEKTRVVMWDIGPSAIVVSSTPSPTTTIKSDDHVKYGGSLPTALPTTGAMNCDSSEEAESHSKLQYDAGVAQACSSKCGDVSGNASSNAYQYHSTPFCHDIEHKETTAEVNAQDVDEHVKDIRPDHSASPGIEEGARPAPSDLMDEGTNDIDLGCPIGMTEDDSHVHRMFSNKPSSFPEFQALKQHLSTDTLALNMPPPFSGQRETHAFHAESSTNVKMSPACIEKTGEKGIHHLSEDASDNADLADQFQDEEEKLCLNICASSEASPIRSYIRKKKPEEVVFSAGDFIASQDEDDSDDSVKSSNKGAFLAIKNKQILEFEQQLITGSRNVKQKLKEQPGATCFTANRSSFMNWISNMVKGLGKPNEDEAPSGSLLLVNYDKEREKQKYLIACNTIEGRQHSNIGFQSFFQSMYRSNEKMPEKEIFQAHEKIDEGCLQLELLDDRDPMSSRMHNFDADGCIPLPIAEVPLEEVHQSDENTATFHPNSQGDLANKNCSTPASDEIKDGVCSRNYFHRSSLGKRNADAAADPLDIQPDVKKGRTLVSENDLLCNTWVSRFGPRPSGHAVIVAHGSQHPDENLGAGKHDSEELVKVLDNQLQYGPMENEASHGPPPPRFKSSEAMASVCLKKLDALRSIILPDSRENTAQQTITCLFCGAEGHQLQDCAEITEVELGELLRNATSYNGSETSLCLCIRCFQLNHWAIGCPDLSSREQLGSTSQTFFMTRNFSSGGQSARGLDRNMMGLENFENQQRAAGEHTLPEGSSCSRHPQMSANLNQVTNDTSSSQKTSLLNLYPVEAVSGPTHGFPASIEATKPPGGVTAMMSEALEGIFEAVKKLRLSRSDVVRWIGSTVQFSNLDGYYLRVRLGKLGGRLGGTGYHVACIIGTPRESSAWSPKEPICVDVGGVRCSIGSQYISNQDFLEDELMAWWSTTNKGGFVIPSEEDLRAKIEERIQLGL